MTSETNLESIGRLAQLLQASPAAIRAAASRAGVRPALTLNGVQHFADGSIGAIRAELRRAAGSEHNADAQGIRGQANEGASQVEGPGGRK
jgi:hypothetical protein